MPDGTPIENPIADSPVNAITPELIRFNPYGGYLADALQTLRKSGLDIYADQVSQTVVEKPAPFTDSQIVEMEAVLGPANQFSNFLSAYATARWGGDSSHAEWKSPGDRQWHKENIAAKFWWQLTPEQRNNFYLRMTRKEAENFWNEKIRTSDQPVIKIIVENRSLPRS